MYRRKIPSGAQMNGDVYSPGMDFRLSDEQLEFQRHCHAFARDVMRPAAARHDRDQTVPHDISARRAPGDCTACRISSASGRTRAA